MLIECGAPIEFPVAQIALPVNAIERPVCHRIAEVDLVVPPDLLVGEDPVHIAFLENTVDCLAVHALGIRARAGFEMMTDTGGRDEMCLAEGTGHLGTLVDSGVEML